jgi:uncharacterized protein
MAVYRILSLDGGGIRGVLSATILENLDQKVPGFMNKMDLIAGTSTGGILALALASGLTPTQARELYVDLGKKVFVHKDIIQKTPGIGQLVEADYPNEPLKEELFAQFGDKTLGDLQKNVLISSFDLDNASTDIRKPRIWKPKFFHNFPGPGSDSDQKVMDVALRTSAAPTYFPIYQGYIDGGIIANNPSMCALAQALHPSTGQQKLKDIRLLSVGTGSNPKYLPEMNSNWGLISWAPHLIGLMMGGSEGLADYQCAQILGTHYTRIDPILPVEIGLDAVNQIQLMETLAVEFDMSDAVVWVKQKIVKR